MEKYVHVTLIVEKSEDLDRFLNLFIEDNFFYLSPSLKKEIKLVEDHFKGQALLGVESQLLKPFKQFATSQGFEFPLKELYKNKIRSLFSLPMLEEVLELETTPQGYVLKVKHFTALSSIFSKEGTLEILKIKKEVVLEEEEFSCRLSFKQKSGYDLGSIFFLKNLKNKFRSPEFLSQNFNCNFKLLFQESLTSMAGYYLIKKAGQDVQEINEFVDCNETLQNNLNT